MPKGARRPQAPPRTHYIYSNFEAPPPVGAPPKSPHTLHLPALRPLAAPLAALLLGLLTLACHTGALLTGGGHPGTPHSLPPSALVGDSTTGVRSAVARFDSTTAGRRAAAALDSLNAAARRLSAHLDSLRHAHPTDSLDARIAADSLALAQNAHLRQADSAALADTTRRHADTLRVRKAGIDAPVQYAAKDSLVYDAHSGLAYLYGDASVKYQNMGLKADYITLNMDSSLVRATGVPDSTGQAQGQPVYTQGSEKYESREMAFNFKTKKGFINDVKTTQGTGLLYSVDAKRTGDGNFYLQNAQYTTCDAPHPHFYLQLTRAKVTPGKETFFGPAYLVVADVPLPVAIPYGFFPVNKKYSSGLIMPTYGDETARGFYLRDGGYYFALSDRMDLKLLGEIYTRGSWGLSAESNYARRYSYRGNVFLSYLTTVNGDKNMPDYTKQTSLKVQWSHSSDPKANPNTSFSARVNFATQNYERSNLASLYTPLAYTQSTRASSVSFSHSVPSLGLSLSASANVSQDMRNASLSVSLPDVSLSVARFYPLRRSKAVGKERWYEKIALSYTGQMTNSLASSESQFFHTPLLKWRNGMQHRIPVEATFQLFKYINISPSFNLSGRTYFSRQRKSWNTAAGSERTDTVYGFYNLFDWNVALSANTTLYGFYKPVRLLFGDRVQAFRHVFKPAVSFSFAPDFTDEARGFTTHYVRTNPDGTVSTVSYSPYAIGAYGYPNATRQGTLNFSVSNNLEMKIKSDADTSGFRKISLIDELSASLSYNLAAKVRPWSDLSTNLRLRLTKSYTFSLAAQWATYAYEFDDKGNVVVGNRTEWSYGRFGRFQGMSQNLSYTLNGQKLLTLFGLLTGHGWDKLLHPDRDTDAATLPQRKHGPDDDADADEEQGDPQDDANIDPMLRRKPRKEQKAKARVDEDGYLLFALPWNLTFSYGISMAEDRAKPIHRANMRYPYSFTQTLNCSGNLTLSKGWNINFTSGYDFTRHAISMTTAALSRDLHCFQMTCNVVLYPYSSFNFSIRAKAAELADALRYEKRSAYSSNIDWY